MYAAYAAMKGKIIFVIVFRAFLFSLFRTPLCRSLVNQSRSRLDDRVSILPPLSSGLLIPILNCNKWIECSCCSFNILACGRSCEQKNKYDRNLYLMLLMLSPFRVRRPCRNSAAAEFCDLVYACPAGDARAHCLHRDRHAAAMCSLRSWLALISHS